MTEHVLYWESLPVCMITLHVILYCMQFCEVLHLNISNVDVMLYI